MQILKQNRRDIGRESVSCQLWRGGSAEELILCRNEWDSSGCGLRQGPQSRRGLTATHISCTPAPSQEQKAAVGVQEGLVSVNLENLDTISLSSIQCLI